MGNSVYVIGEQKDDKGAVVKDDKARARLVVGRLRQKPVSAATARYWCSRPEGRRAGGHEQKPKPGSTMGAHVAIVEDQASSQVGPGHLNIGAGCTGEDCTGLGLRRSQASASQIPFIRRPVLATVVSLLIILRWAYRPSANW